MTRRPEDLARLREIANMLLETRAAALRRAAAARDQVQWQLDSLDRTQPETVTGGEMLNTLAYEEWAARRRAELNMQLARRRAQWQLELDGTRLAFGRLPAISKMAGPSRKR